MMYLSRNNSYKLLELIIILRFLINSFFKLPPSKTHRFFSQHPHKEVNCMFNPNLIPERGTNAILGLV